MQRITHLTDPTRSSHPPMTAAAWSADTARVFLPVGFEKYYAYPVLVFLTPAEQGNGAFHDQMLAISDRNFVGINIPVGVEEGGSLEQLQERVETAVQAVNAYANLHGERIYLLGTGGLARTAMQLALDYQFSYAGFIATAPVCQPQDLSLKNFRKFRHLRGLILDRTQEATSTGAALAKMLHHAGLELRYQPLPATSASHESSGSPQINGFIMQAILASYCLNR